MISGILKVRLTPETILNRISDYDIFRYYMPNKSWKINVVTFSPFRDEQHPSFLIGNKFGVLTFIDFADSSKKGDCFNFVKCLYNLVNINDVLKLIDKDFHLGIVDKAPSEEYKTITSIYKQPEDKGKRYSLIQVVTKKFTNEELSYWNNYHLDIQDLKDNNVYSLKAVYLNKTRFIFTEPELKFGYFYDGYWKIYRPFANKKYKWVPNNVPITTMDGKDDIKDCDVAFINKSKKDYMVMKKVFPCSCAVQNEGMGCFSKENVEFLKTNSKKQILSFDSDVIGVKNSQQITTKLGFDYCNVPRKYLNEGIKDWAALAATHGLDVIKDILKQKQLI